MTNPFTSKTFVTIWSKHFNNRKDGIKFDSIEKVLFYKKKFLPLYINIGRNLTKGIDYTINYKANDYKNKVFLIYDIPDFFNVETIDESQTALRCKPLFQYQGFLLDFKSFATAEDYIKSRTSAKNIRGFRSRTHRLETCFDISYKFYTKEIDLEVFDLLFNQFRNLLSKRFADKQVNYHHLSADKWAFHKEFVYAMLQENKASLFVIYNGKTPIGITLNIHSETIVFVAITVFDQDYYKFNIGKLTIVKIIEWCYENNMTIADFSKGDFDFKHEWCNVAYDFNYHLLYDSKSLISKNLTHTITLFYKLKLYLRNHHVNTLYRKLLFKLHAKNNYSHPTDVVLEDLNEFKSDITFEDVYLNDTKVDYIKNFVYSFLFANPEPLKAIKVYKKKTSKTFVIAGSQKAQRVTFN